jgi:hypothetical protein
MTNEHPITPPPELVGQWLCSEDYQWDPLEQASITITTNRLQNVATQAAQWGADQELEACCEWLDEMGLAGSGDIEVLRAARRPKPPSLKEQALELARAAGIDGAYVTFGPEELTLIRRALEALDD